MTSQSQLLLKLMKAKGYNNTLMDNFIQNNLPDAQRTALSIQVISYGKTGAQYRDKCWWNVLETTEVIQLKIKTNGQRRKFRGSWHKYPQKINVIQDCRFFFLAFDSLWQHSMLMIICFHLCRFLFLFFVSFLLLYIFVYSVCICMTKQIYTSAFFLASAGQRVDCTKLLQNGSDVEPACSWTAGTFSLFSWYELRSLVTVQSSRRNESVDFLGLSHPVLLL